MKSKMSALMSKIRTGKRLSNAEKNQLRRNANHARKAKKARRR